MLAMSVLHANLECIVEAMERLRGSGDYSSVCRPRNNGYENIYHSERTRCYSVFLVVARLGV